MTQIPTLPVPEPETNSRDARLASELVANLRPRTEVAQAYGYTPAALSAKLRDSGFKRILRETKELWESDTNAKDRIRKKAALLVEDSLLDIYGIVTDDSVTPNVRNASFENLAKVADVTAPSKGGVGEGSGFKVVINLPDPDKSVTLSAPIIEHEAE